MSKRKPSDKEMRADIAASVRLKAWAIAQGSYDKDVDFDAQERVLWAARLYVIADKIVARQKLTLREHEELTDCDNYLPKDNYTPFLIRNLLGGK